NTQKFKGNEEIAKIIKYIGNNYSDALSSKQLSEKFGFSLSYFCRIFKNTVGETPINYVNAVRINKACELLQKTSLPVTEVAGAVGYTGINYFNRQFKKIMKCTPLQLRNRHP
ncbi:MAG: AraC family transcriptional regulator, partial [Oscillospiraceae bacterium]